MPLYFLDTCALIEISEKNPKFEKFARITDSVTSSLNLMELYFAVLREDGRQKAETAYNFFAPARINYSEETMKKAMELKLKLKTEEKLRISHVDAVGYQIAIENGLKFVTGDGAFKELENVEFVR